MFKLTKKKQKKNNQFTPETAPVNISVLFVFAENFRKIANVMFWKYRRPKR